MSHIKTLRRAIIMKVVGIEGDYSNDPLDSGGKTNYGITEHVANKYGYDVQKLSVAQAVDIYEKGYWHELYGDKIALISESIMHEIYDTGVNLGVERAAEYLQRSLNVLNGNGKYYPDLVVDGDIGKATSNALKAYLNRRGNQGEHVLLNMLNALQGAHYVRLAERREKDERFVYGWFDNRVEIA